MKKDIGKVCRWKHPRAPSARLLWKNSDGGDFGFLEETLRWPPEEEEGEESEGEEGGRALLENALFLFSFLPSFPLEVGTT